MDPSKELDKTVRHLEKKLAELQDLARDRKLDLSASIQDLRAVLERLRDAAHAGAKARH